MTARAKPAPEAKTKATPPTPALPPRAEIDPQNHGTQISSAREAAKLEAKSLLTAAQALGIAVGSNGSDVITIARSPVPLELGRWFHSELCKHRAAVIAIIENENAARTGRLVPDAVEDEEGSLS
jgi:hypothetical protein